MNRRRTQTAFADARQRSTRAIPRWLKLARGVGHAAPVSLGTTCDVVLFDLTSTYFEVDGTKALESDLQRYGYSRDKRGDCLQVVVALVLTPRQIIGKFRAVKMVDVVMPTTDGRIVTLPRDVEPKPDLAISAGSARTDVARPAPAEDLKRSCRRGEIDCVVKT